MSLRTKFAVIFSLYLVIENSPKHHENILIRTVQLDSTGLHGMKITHISTAFTWFERGVKESMYTKVLNPSLNKDGDI